VTNLQWSDLSNHLFRWTLVAYFFAFLGYALEYAYGARGAVASAADSQPETAVAADRSEALVGASAGRAVHARVGASLGGSVAAPLGDPVGDAVGGSVGDAPPGLTRPAGPPPRWTVLLGRIAVGLTVLGWGLHLAAVLTRALAAGHVPWGNMYEFSLAVAFVSVTVYLVLLATRQIRYLGLWIMTPVTVYLLIAGTSLYSAAGPLMPILSKSYWLLVHVTAILTATGALMVAGVVAVMNLLRRRYEAAAEAGEAPTRGLVSLAARLAPARSLDKLEYRMVAFAFPVYTFAVIAGAVWAESAWGRYWGWDPKETWSFVTWLVYAAYLHARTTAGWRRWASTISLTAFGCLMANYFIVNLIIVGKHSYAQVNH
jgi:cytochrome c-type biogenesis protein CcsB